MTAPGERLPPPSTVTELLLARASNTEKGLIFDDRQWTWAEHVQECVDRAALLNSLRRPGPFHIGVLLDNVPEYSFLLGGAALAGATVVGLNTSRRGESLVRDIRLSECQVVITDSRYVELLQGLDHGARVLDIDSAAWHVTMFRHQHSQPAPVPANPDDLLALVFTAGTTGEPKPVRYTHADLTGPARSLTERFGLTARDVAYVSMPLFHASALTAGWATALTAGAAVALAGRFSSTGFLDDVRILGATYTTYTGLPLSYLLATPPDPDDGTNPLRLVFGHGADTADVEAFARRFNCEVVDSYASTEDGPMVPHPDDPVGSLGRLDADHDVLDPETGKPCPPATVDADGRVTNPAEAIGELVNTAGSVAAYHDTDGLRDGMFWTGDQVYRDEQGFCYFVGRAAEEIRAGDEVVGTAPVERILARYPAFRDVAAYGVPDPRNGEAVMVAVVLRPEVTFDAKDFTAFLTAQPDLTPAWTPRYVRLTSRLPRTATYQVLRRTLVAQRWRTQDPIWWRAGPGPEFEPLTPSSDPIRLDWGTGSVRR
jgi:fatty-acyl-CoA synthase